MTAEAVGVAEAAATVRAVVGARAMAATWLIAVGAVAVMVATWTVAAVMEATWLTAVAVMEATMEATPRWTNAAAGTFPGGAYLRRHDHDGKFARDHDDRHFSNRDRDHDHGNRHRVFRNGVWVWVYGPDYYAGGDCEWMLHRAQVTGSPYWWRRYNLCVDYY